MDSSPPTPTASRDVLGELAAARQAIARLEETIMDQRRTIDERDKTIEALAEHAARANTDELTGLPTRRQLRYWWDDLGTDPASMIGAVMLIDLNGLHSLNEQWGHDGGDKIIVRVAESISALTGDTHPIKFAARLGGDEFFAAIRRGSTDSETIEAASNAAQRIIDLVSEPLPVGHDEDGNVIQIQPAVSIGIRVGVDPQLFLSMRQADVAMFDAKKAAHDADDGTGRYSISIQFGPAEPLDPA